MIRIQQLKLKPDHTDSQLLQAVAKALKLPAASIKSYKIVRQSIDARKKSDIQYVYTIDVEISKEHTVLKKLHNPNITNPCGVIYTFPSYGTTPLKERPVIIGSGPAGLYCALLLSQHGYRPIVLERGEAVDKRKAAIDYFWNNGRLSANSNVQFGEGGAGTFSDGKLNTLVKDPLGRNRKVLEVFVDAGAPSDILYISKPHIGTDILQTVVKNIREQIIANGGEFLFQSQVTDIEITNDKVSGVTINNNKTIKSTVVVLAIGHSARDTFEMLSQKTLHMEQKAFAVGIRIEHPQAMINLAQYGAEHPKYLPTADYKLTKQLSNRRGIYSFCMCPGGYVVNASSEPGRLAVNGMSYHDRAGQNANSALIVTVTPNDFGNDNIMAGIDYQRKLEEAAFRMGNGKVPIQLFGDYKENKATTSLGDVAPCIKGGYNFANIRELLPGYLGDSILEGITAFDKTIKGFGRYDAVLSAIESRTSSPIRITRNTEFESSISGIYPCGEGAGYAGGITSAAMDGIKIAEVIAARYHPF